MTMGSCLLDHSCTARTLVPPSPSRLGRIIPPLRVTFPIVAAFYALATTPSVLSGSLIRAIESPAVLALSKTRQVFAQRFGCILSFRGKRLPSNRPPPSSAALYTARPLPACCDALHCTYSCYILNHLFVSALPRCSPSAPGCRAC